MKYKTAGDKILMPKKNTAASYLESIAAGVELCTSYQYGALVHVVIPYC